MSEFSKRFPKPENTSVCWHTENYERRLRREGWLEALKWVMKQKNDYLNSNYFDPPSFLAIQEVEQEIEQIEKE